MVYADFTTFTENDPNNDITVTKNKIEVDTLDRVNVEAYVYTSKTIQKTFTHRLKVVWTGSDAVGEVGVYGQSNTPSDTLLDMLNNNEGFALYLLETGGNYYWRIAEYVTDTNDTYAAAGYETRYLSIERANTNLQILIYSDDTFSTLVDTIAVTLQNNTTFDYVHVVLGRDAGGGIAGEITFDVENLDLGSTPWYPDYLSSLFVK